MNKRLILIHGAGSKPSESDLLALWVAALRSGLQRDYGDSEAEITLPNCDLLYFADMSGANASPDIDSALDLQSRQLALSELQKLGKARDFRRRFYDALPGKSPVQEFVMDAGASLGAGGLLLKKKLPELHDYLSGAAWGAALRTQAADRINAGLEAGDDVMVIAHCMGSVVAYDAMWTLSRERGVAGRVDFVSLGSPLSDRSVQGRLCGAKASSPTRYPDLIHRWSNLSAEDDFACHDKTLADDFRAMLDSRLLSEIQDYTIYNLTVRHGRSDPRNSLGYLIHPRMAQILSDWLSRS